MFWHKGFQLRHQIARKTQTAAAALKLYLLLSCSQKCLAQLHYFFKLSVDKWHGCVTGRNGFKETIKGWQQSQEVFRGQNLPFCDQMKHLLQKPKIALGKLGQPTYETEWLQQWSHCSCNSEAVPRESIKQLVPKEDESYSPKKIRETSFFFLSVLLSTQASTISVIQSSFSI